MLWDDFARAVSVSNSTFEELAIWLAAATFSGQVLLLQGGQERHREPRWADAARQKAHGRKVSELRFAKGFGSEVIPGVLKAEVRRVLRRFWPTWSLEAKNWPQTHSWFQLSCILLFGPSCPCQASDLLKRHSASMSSFERRLYLCRYDPIGAGRVQAVKLWNRAGH